MSNPIGSSFPTQRPFPRSQGSKVSQRPKQAMVKDSSFYATCNAADPYQSFQRAPRPTKAKWPSTESLPYPLS